MKCRLVILVILVIGWIGGFAGPAGAQRRYIATDLGDFPGGVVQNIPYSLNNAGQVVGSSVGSFSGGATSVSRPFLWTPNVPNGTTGTMVDLGHIGQPVQESGAAYGINDSGQVVGRAGGEIFLWNPAHPNGTSGVMQGLHDPPVTSRFETFAAINASGQVVVRAQFGPPGPPASLFMRTPSTPGGALGTLTDMSLVDPSCTFTFGGAVNNGGQVAGWNKDQLLLFTPDVPNATTGSVTLIGMPAEYERGGVGGLNSQGQVVGWVSDDTFGDDAFLWTPDTPNGPMGTFRLLRAGPIGTSGAARDINDLGEVVGKFREIDETYEFASLWTDSEGFLDLNMLLDEPLGTGWLLDEAVAINEAGQILVQGIWNNEDFSTKPIRKAFLLTPVPEPVFGAGALLFIVLFGRRHRGGYG